MAMKEGRGTCNADLLADSRDIIMTEKRNYHGCLLHRFGLVNLTTASDSSSRARSRRAAVANNSAGTDRGKFISSRPLGCRAERLTLQPTS